MPYEKHLRSSVAGKLPTPAQLAEGQVALNFNASDPFLAIKDAAGVVRRVTGVHQGTTAPLTPTGGMFWLDTSKPTAPLLKVYDGTNWIGAGGGVTGSGTAPASPSRGDVWVNTTGTGDPVLSIWDGTKWVALAGIDSPTFTGVPAGPTAAAGTDTTQLATTAFVQSAQLWAKTGTTLGVKTAGDLVAAAALPAATAAAQGAVRLADAAAITAGTAGRVVDASHAATETAKGIVELATAVETTTGTDATRAVHPAGLKVELDKKVKLSGDTMTGNLTVPSLNGGQLAGFRNHLINGAFSVNQRGDASYTAPNTTASARGYDCWYHASAAGISTVLQRQGVAANGFGIDYALSASAACYICQNIELLGPGIAGPFATGTTWTLSYLSDKPVKASGAQFTVGKIDTGATVIPAPPAVSTGITFAGFTQYTQTFQISVAPASTHTSIRVSLLLDPGTKVGGIQLEPGPAATPFEHRPYATELAMSQRYLYVLGGEHVNQVFAQGFNLTAVQANFHFFHPVKMRTAPTLVNSPPPDFQVSNGVAAYVGTAIATAGAQSSTCSIVTVTVAGGLPASQASRFECNKTTSRMIWSAEL